MCTIYTLYKSVKIHLVMTQKNGRDGTCLIPPRQVSFKLNIIIKMRKFYNKLKSTLKIWLSRVQVSKVLQLIQKKHHYQMNFFLESPLKRQTTILQISKKPRKRRE